MAVQLIHSDGWLEHVSDGFFRALLRAEKSPKTVRSYGNGIKHFFAYLRDQGVDDMHDLTREHLEGWQDHMRELEPCSSEGRL